MVSTFVIGYFFEWPLKRVITLGFVISLSSTAVVIKLLQERNELNSNVGQKRGGDPVGPGRHHRSHDHHPELFRRRHSFKIADAEAIDRRIVSLWASFGTSSEREKLSLPFQKFIRRDHEIQVFLAIVICFGFSLITSFLGLSSALGAFVAGILVSSFRATHWVHESLHAFRVVFVALFFVSIGMLIDLAFIEENVLIIGIFVLMVLIVNNLINASIFMLFGQNWRDSIYAGAILAQIGEFSFILGSTGYVVGIVSDFTYKLIVSIISLTLLISPLWITIIRSALHPDIKSQINRIFR